MEIVHSDSRSSTESVLTSQLEIEKFVKGFVYEANTVKFDLLMLNHPPMARAALQTTDEERRKEEARIHKLKHDCRAAFGLDSEPAYVFDLLPSRLINKNLHRKWFREWMDKTREACRSLMEVVDKVKNFKSDSANYNHSIQVRAISNIEKKFASAVDLIRTSKAALVNSTTAFNDAIRAFQYPVESASEEQSQLLPNSSSWISSMQAWRQVNVLDFTVLAATGTSTPQCWDFSWKLWAGVSALWIWRISSRRKLNYLDYSVLGLTGVCTIQGWEFSWKLWAGVSALWIWRISSPAISSNGNEEAAMRKEMVEAVLLPLGERIIALQAYTETFEKDIVSSFKDWIEHAATNAERVDSAFVDKIPITLFEELKECCVHVNQYLDMSEDPRD
ncbi:hypothetical protein HDU84_009203 [Entophlyctis sp. JEL0112]|nr:hypothetical protein HDU84_009203 [Entophlyctis sp. JEL0112]